MYSFINLIISFFLFMELMMIIEIKAVEPWVWNLPAMEKEHDPGMFRDHPARYVNGSSLPEPAQSPDWRTIEPPWYAKPAAYLYQEQDRPYRISPHFKQMYKWKNIYRTWFESTNVDYPDALGCYCTTVYRRFTVLAGCAVLTPRHILTTATSTEVVIRDRHNDKTLEEVLGLWYDISLDLWNSSMYATPARIHYHPKYLRPSHVNASHPLPNVFDLAVWASTYPLHSYAKYCERANSGWWTYGPTIPVWSDMVIIVGFQYIKALRKKPMPWFKYAVRTKQWVRPCPKNEWGWFHCMSGTLWGKYGVESGAAWHRSVRKGTRMYDGLAGMCSFSLRHRSDEIIHYFTVINTHPVLDFLYDAYMGRLPYEYLDQRFYDNQWRAPRPKSWYYVEWRYRYGEAHYANRELPFYK